MTANTEGADISGKLQSGETIKISAKKDLTLNGTSQLLALQKIDLASEQTLEQKTGSIVQGGGDVHLKGHLINQNGRIHSDKKLELMAEDLSLGGKLTALEDIKANATHDLTQGEASEILTNQALNLTAGNRLTQKGVIKAGGDIALNGNEAMLSGRIISENNISLKALTGALEIGENALIYGGNEVSAQSASFLNKGILSSQNKTEIKTLASNLENRGLLHSEHNLSLFSGNIDNQASLCPETLSQGGTTDNTAPFPKYLFDRQRPID